MEEMTFDEALQFLYENLGPIFNAIELIILALLNRKIKKGDKITTSESVIAKAADQKMEVSSSVSSPKTVKKQISNQLLSDLELLFSDKEDDQLTEDEKTRISALTSYLLEVKK